MVPLLGAFVAAGAARKTAFRTTWASIADRETIFTAQHELAKLVRLVYQIKEKSEKTGYVRGCAG
jgi:hypothetical protein